jgi:hypothetical protein
MADMMSYVLTYYDKQIESSSTIKNFKKGRKLVHINGNTNNVTL